MHGDGGLDLAGRGRRLAVAALNVLRDRRFQLGLLGLLVVLAGAAWWSSSARDAEWSGRQRDGAVTTRFDPATAEPREPVLVTPDVGPLGLGEGGTDPVTVVTCAVTPSLESVSAAVLDDALPEIPEVARIEDGVLVIAAPRSEGRGALLVEGYVPVPFSWAEGRCASEPLVLIVGSAAIVGQVSHADGEAAGSVRVHGCGSSVTTGSDGSFYLEGIPGRACTVTASRSDGIYTATSPEVKVTPVANADQVVDLQLPPFRTAGIGVRFTESAAGVEITHVVSGGSAAEAGLAPGDRLVSVDGEDAEMASLDELQSLLQGEAGSLVEVELEGEDGQIRTLALERREM